MCGIMGYVGQRPAAEIIMNGLKRLEYRGYDSAGLAVAENGTIDVRKASGKITALQSRLAQQPVKDGFLAIGHTRWATHGPPVDGNAHPHQDCQGQLAVVHNGIIENFAQLRQELRAAGHNFVSDTDTEVIPHLIEDHIAAGDDLPQAVRRSARRLKGSYAMAVISKTEPGTMVAVRQDSPLVLGLGETETFLASDIPALLDHTKQVMILEDGDYAVIRQNHIEITDMDGQPLDRSVTQVTWDPQQAERGGFPHFMLKEIHEQPQAVRDTIRPRIHEAGIDLSETDLSEEHLRQIRQVHLVACGTAYHAGLVGKALLEAWARLPVEVDVASEYRYRNPLAGEETLAVAVSQSGETADTLQALREAKKRGARSLAICNVVGASIAREAQHVLYTQAGPEISVASTKAYTAQLSALALLALELARLRGTMPEERVQELVRELAGLPDRVAQVLGEERTSQVESLAQRASQHPDVFFIGRGLDYALALEGQLKFKEITYRHAEAYPAGELKHGTLALIDDGVPLVAVATQPHLIEKTASNVEEAKARGAWVTAVAMEGQPAEVMRELTPHVITIPAVDPWLAPIVAAVPLQLFSYYAAAALGRDIDQPRNLAKSVTVE